MTIQKTLDEAVAPEDRGPRCQYCGKPISADSALEHEAGSRCQALREQGFTTDGLLKHRISMTKDEVPDDYMKVAVLADVCRRNGVPVSRMVDAIGGDRCTEGESPVDSRLTPIYSGRNRWVSKWAATVPGLVAMLGSKKVRNSDKLNPQVRTAWELAFAGA